jgi:hypothetical protein
MTLYRLRPALIALVLVITAVVCGPVFLLTVAGRRA